MGRNQTEEQKLKGTRKVNSGRGKVISQHYEIFAALRDFAGLSSSALSSPFFFFGF